MIDRGSVSQIMTLENDEMFALMKLETSSSRRMELRVASVVIRSSCSHDLTPMGVFMSPTLPSS